MGTFIGGSAFSMSKEIMEGYILISPNSLKKFSNPEMQTLQLELEKLQRELRSEQIQVDNVEAVKKKNRRIQRITSALTTIKNVMQSRR